MKKPFGDWSPGSSHVLSGVFGIAILLGLLFHERKATAANDALSQIRERGVLRWGADAEGGAPYVFQTGPNLTNTPVLRWTSRMHSR